MNNLLNPQSSMNALAFMASNEPRPEDLVLGILPYEKSRVCLICHNGGPSRGIDYNALAYANLGKPLDQRTAAADIEAERRQEAISIPKWNILHEIHAEIEPKRLALQALIELGNPNPACSPVVGLAQAARGAYQRGEIWSEEVDVQTRKDIQRARRVLMGKPA